MPVNSVLCSSETCPVLPASGSVRVALFLLVFSIMPLILHSQSLMGTTGLFNIPAAELMPDKTVMVGFNQIPKEYSPYGNFQYNNMVYYATVTFLPRVELMFRYTYRLGAGVRRSDTNFFMDRMVSARFLLLREGEYRPSLLLGFHDPGKSVNLAANNTFSANYASLSKNLELLFLNTGLHLGYAFDIPGQKTLTHRGAFGGVTLAHRAFPALQLIFEYDSAHVNQAVKVLLFNRIQLMGGLIHFDKPAGGISYRVQL